MEPIRVRPGEPGRLKILLPYSPERVEKIKTVSGRRWHKEEKYWSVPHFDKAVEKLQQLFAGEQVLVSPGAGQPQAPREPELSQAQAEQVSDLLKRLRGAARARHFSPSTESTYASWTDRFLRRHAGKPPEQLGEAEIAGAKKAMGWDLPPFEVPAEVYGLFREAMARGYAACGED